jgi:dihydropteroate synthase
MGIVNVTPDSFFDGGHHADPQQAIDHAWKLVGEGADILDIGGESSRPGAEPVEAGLEIERVLPVIEALAGHSRVLLSVDTTKAEVAKAALQAGAHILNDISGLRHDPEMVNLAGQSGAGIVLMHMQGTPQTMQMDPTYGDVVTEIAAFFDQRLSALAGSGVSLSHVVLDPGMGFGKSFDHNWTLLNRLPELTVQGVPLLVGVSRKRFLGELCGRDVQDRLPASLAALTAAVLSGAAIVRVHDVKESCDAVRVADRLRRENRHHAKMDTATARS